MLTEEIYPSKIYKLGYVFLTKINMETDNITSHK